VTFLLVRRCVGVLDVVDAWQGGVDRFCERIGPRFGRSEPRGRVAGYVRGLAAPLDRRNGWTIAEHAAEVSPDGMQRLLRQADWDVDGVRDDLRDLVVEQLGDPDAVVVADETGFQKKGSRSAGVQRQYSGTMGRRENCQIGVFLTYVSDAGHALIDRELYLPESWLDDRDRCQAAGIPDEVQFATKPRLAMAMLQRALDGGVPFGWFAADEAYGHASYLRTWLQERRISYVLAVQSNDTITTRTGDRARIDQLAASLPATKWRKISAGDGAHAVHRRSSPRRQSPRHRLPLQTRSGRSTGRNQGPGVHDRHFGSGR